MPEQGLGLGGPVDRAICVLLQSGFGCREGHYHGVVDAANEVAESDESNNTADAQQIC